MESSEIDLSEFQDQDREEEAGSGDGNNNNNDADGTNGDNGEVSPTNFALQSSLIQFNY